MTEAGSTYGEGLYSLALAEGISQAILEQLNALDESFTREPDFLHLLSSPSLTKAERCQILDDSFRGKLQPYLLNFLKILTEKGYICHFHHCVLTYRALYNRDNGILSVTAVTAVPLTDSQSAKLTQKLQHITGKQIALTNKPDPAVLGGIRLDYDGKRVDDTIAHRLDAMRNLLQNTVL